MTYDFNTLTGELNRLTSEGPRQLGFIVCPYSGGDPPAPVPVECGIELDCKTDETEKLAFEEIQDGVETLIASRLVKGKRVSQSGRIEFVQLRLTAKGEAEAIAAARAKISKATKERWAKFRAAKAKGKQ